MAEIIFGLLFLFWHHKILHYLNISAMVSLLILAAMTLPHTLVAAFNPVVMNAAMASFSILAILILNDSKN